MKVGFLTNLHHLMMTRSSQFLLELLKQLFGEVEVIPQEEVWRFLPRKHFDLLVVFQTLYTPQELEAFGVPRTVLVPMYDASPRSTEFWSQYRSFGILCFCTALFELVKECGLEALNVRYYPKPPDVTARDQDGGLSGFFWPRATDIHWGVIKTVIGDAHFDRLQIHWTENVVREHLPFPQKADREKYNITVSSWFEKKSDYADALGRAKVFFAPRSREGIGMSVLEAMSMGLCVAAADRPTMSEYMTHGTTGLLYDPEKPEPLDFSVAAQIGRAARESCLNGYKQWRSSSPSIKAFLESAPSRPVVARSTAIVFRGKARIGIRKAGMFFFRISGARLLYHAYRKLRVVRQERSL